MSDAEDFTQAELDVAKAILADPSIELMAKALASARRAGERWVEISAAHWIREELNWAGKECDPASLADKIEDRTWRRPAYQSQLDLDAEAAKAVTIIQQRKDEE